MLLKKEVKVFSILGLVVVMSTSLTGCVGISDLARGFSKSMEVISNATAGKDDRSEAVQRTDVVEDENSDNQSKAETSKKEDTRFETASFEKFAGDYYFASGAGGWGTNVTINADGSIEGYFSDSDMGDTGEDYPSGKVYTSDFSGQFGELTQISEHLYVATLEELNIKDEVNTYKIEDEIRYEYTEPYGIDEGTYMFYDKGTPTRELPYGLLDWLSMPRCWYYDDGSVPEKLDIRAFYNVNGDAGFGE